MNYYKYGLKKGIPIGIGYLAVSFAFGVMCTNNGMSPLMSTIISFTNLTSAGQFAGVQLIFQVASLIEILLTVLIINLRYALMSLSLSQKIDKDTSRINRLFSSLAITDEIFAVAITEKEKVNTKYLMGLLTFPLLGWTLGTLIGALGANIIPERFLNAMNISLYAMFIAIIVPSSKKDYRVLIVSLLSILITCLFTYLPYLSSIGLGFKTIIATIISSIFGALVFKRKEEVLTNE